MKNHSNQGSVLIGVLMALGLAAFFYVGSSTSFFKSLTRQKTKSHLDLLTKSLNNAIFNYTSYAIKERWCLEESWGRDTSCSKMTELKNFVTHPRNLERFLWSKSTINDISLRYQAKYGAPPPMLSLDKLEQVVTIEKLESLGSSHPLNLAMNDIVRECLTSIHISIERPLSNYYKSQGDEVYLIIKIKGNLSRNPLNQCTFIKSSPVVTGLVIFYPRTLNQFVLIKTNSFIIRDFPEAEKGVNFYGPVFVQNNIQVKGTGKRGVSFKDKVILSEGSVTEGWYRTSPKTPGGFSDQLLSQLDSMNGFMNGISLEAEPDLGMQYIFGSFIYPSESNIGMCANRNNLKDNLNLTKDSRLWIKGSNGNFSFTLSGDNEFREYIRHGSNNGKYIYNKLLPGYNESSPNRKYTFNVNLKDEPTLPKPVMEAHISINGTELSTVYMGRDSEATITFGDTAFFKTQKDLLNTSDQSYLEISNFDKDGLGISNDFIKGYNDFKSACNSAGSVGIPECKKVMMSGAVDVVTNCSALPTPSEIATCDNKLVQLKKEKIKYFALHNELVNDLNGFIINPPGLTIKNSGVLANKEDVKLIWSNKESFKYKFVSQINKLKIRFNVYDFGIEESTNTIFGERLGRNGRLPGPNGMGTGKENSLVYDLSRNSNGDVASFEIKKSDGDVLNANSTHGTTLQTWSTYSSDIEPPGNHASNSKIVYPVDGISLDEMLQGDIACKSIYQGDMIIPSWDISFTEKTQFSWLYNVTSSGITITDPGLVQIMPSYTFSKADMDPGAYQGVPTRSIVNECVVPKDIDFVFGFYVCKTLIIEPRTTLLNLVGTFIIEDFKIDKSASVQGVNFYSIWNPGGIELLKANKHLRREKSASGECKFDKPGWFQGLDNDTLADYQSCSPAKFLYEGANNFNWTTVDPEIGITSEVGQTVTKSKITNRYRRYGLNVVWLRNGLEQ